MSKEILGEEAEKTPLDLIIDGLGKRLGDKALVVISGGQDSITCLYWAMNRFKSIEAITFDYGQRHREEIEVAKEICTELNIGHKVVDVEKLFSTITESALISKDQDVNELGASGLPSSFVPNRNQIFLTLAHTYAQKIKADSLITGVCETDYSGYPDCRREFIDCLQFTSSLGSGMDINIHTPLMYIDKADTFRLAEKLGVLPTILGKTLTCYEGDIKMNEWGRGCGECSSCKLRKQGYYEYKERYRRL